MSILIDDFQVILGMEFLQNHKVLLMPCVESPCLFGETPCVITVMPKKTNKELLLDFQVERVEEGEDYLLDCLEGGE